eukprot:12423827-Karenia_brevis.AAC.1
MVGIGGRIQTQDAIIHYTSPYVPCNLCPVHEKGIGALVESALLCTTAWLLQEREEEEEEEDSESSEEEEEERLQLCI